jgi:inorganic pyrophosphatase
MATTAGIGHFETMIPPPLETLPHELDRSKMTCQAIVEAPAGSRLKVYYDPDSHRFRIGKFLPLGMVFPLDFAFVPSTLAGDGDPVDLLILPEATLAVGSIVNVRILGILEAEQYKGNKKPRRNDRVIARLIESRLFARIQNIDQLGKTFVDELSTFFSTYKRLRGQTYNVIGVGGPDRAADVILECAEEYQRNGGESAS